MGTTRYGNHVERLEIQIDPNTPRSGQLTVVFEDQNKLVLVVTREAVERLYLQLSEQLKQAPLPPDHR